MPTNAGCGSGPLTVLVVSAYVNIFAALVDLEKMTFPCVWWEVKHLMLWSQILCCLPQETKDNVSRMAFSFSPFWGKYRKMRYLWNFRACSLTQNTKTTRNNILLEKLRFNIALSQNDILITIHHSALLLCILYISKSLPTAVKVQRLAGRSHFHLLGAGNSPGTCPQSSFPRRDWTAALCWYPVSQDFQQTHSGTWIWARITFPARLVRIRQYFFS